MLAVFLKLFFGTIVFSVGLFALAYGAVWCLGKAEATWGVDAALAILVIGVALIIATVGVVAEIFG